MKPLNKCAFQNHPTTMSFWSQFMVNRTTKYLMINKKSDQIYQIVVIVAKKIAFSKKVVKMIMKIDVLKSGFMAKKAYYEFWDTLIKRCIVHTRLSMTGLVCKSPLVGSTF